MAMVSTGLVITTGRALTILLPISFPSVLQSVNAVTIARQEKGLATHGVDASTNFATNADKAMFLSLALLLMIIPEIKTYSTSRICMYL